MTTVYHGTSKSAAETIRSSGKITGPVFLTPRREIAASYGEEIIEVQVSEDDLMIDLDLPGGRLLSVESANDYSDRDWTIGEYIKAGHSVGLVDAVKI